MVLSRGRGGPEDPSLIVSPAYEPLVPVSNPHQEPVRLPSRCILVVRTTVLICVYCRLPKKSIDSSNDVGADMAAVETWCAKK
jgi:hypothetical protein